ncbi:MAG: response regulator [Deltaproteobacteria bacterium]|nr:MAG: response regulator [Deltaproteobacteria bacterium]
MASSAKPKVLVVDDEPDMLDFLERVLRRRFDVYRTGNAQQALAWLEAGDFAVLVTDQKMPRLTGLDLLDRIGDRYPKLVKILISGFTDVPDIERAAAQGRIHNYVLKPVDGERLLEAIDEAYAARDRRAPAPAD